MFLKHGPAQITREPGPVKGGSTVIAFAKDPTGYMWELIEREDAPASGGRSEPICQVMLRVTDLGASVAYYTEALGMRLLRRRVNEEQGYTLAFVGYEDEDKVGRVGLLFVVCCLSGASRRVFFPFAPVASPPALFAPSSFLNGSAPAKLPRPPPKK